MQQVSGSGWSSSLKCWLIPDTPSNRNKCGLLPSFLDMKESEQQDIRDKLVASYNKLLLKGYSFNTNRNSNIQNNNVNKSDTTTTNKAKTDTTKKGGFMSGGLMKGLMLGGLAGLLFGSLFANMGVLGSILGFLINVIAIVAIIVIIRKIFVYFKDKKKKERIKTQNH